MREFQYTQLFFLLVVGVFPSSVVETVRSSTIAISEVDGRECALNALRSLGRAGNFLDYVFENEYDPGAMIVVVNKLRTLDRNDAISVLREFEKENWADSGVLGGPRARFRSIEFIIPLVFEIKDCPFEKRILLVDDIPFCLSEVELFSGEPWSASNYFDAIEKGAPMIKIPLKPKDCPLKALATILATVEETGDYRTIQRRTYYIAQTSRLLSQILKSVIRDPTRPIWTIEGRCAQLHGMRIEWNEGDQRFEITPEKQ